MCRAGVRTQRTAAPAGPAASRPLRSMQCETSSVCPPGPVGVLCPECPVSCVNPRPARIRSPAISGSPDPPVHHLEHQQPPGPRRRRPPCSRACCRASEPRGEGGAGWLRLCDGERARNTCPVALPAVDRGAARGDPRCDTPDTNPRPQRDATPRASTVVLIAVVAGCVSAVCPGVVELDAVGSS